MGVLDIHPQSLLAGDREQWEVFFISRLPRLLAILCTGVGMSVAGQLIVEHVYTYSIPISVFITVGGGVYFLYLLLTRRRV